MNIMILMNGKPNERLCWTEKLGVNQCVLDVKKQLSDQYGITIAYATEIAQPNRRN